MNEDTRAEKLEFGENEECSWRLREWIRWYNDVESNQYGKCLNRKDIGYILACMGRDEDEAIRLRLQQEEEEEEEEKKAPSFEGAL